MRRRGVHFLGYFVAGSLARAAASRMPARSVSCCPWSIVLGHLGAVVGLAGAIEDQ
jgi:hypothetical protein